MLLFERIIATISPDSCLSCGDEGTALCQACLEGELTRAGSLCYRCGAMTLDFATCQRCRKRSSLEHVWVAADYEKLARELVHDLKFNAHRSAVRPMAELCAETLPLMDGYIMTHLPTSGVHIRERSFDQTKLMTKHISRRLHLPYHPLLRRVKNVHQTGSNKTGRLRHIKDAFEPKSSYLIKGSKILLVDDVMTTGASLEEAARTLKKAGAKEVCGVVFAR